MEKLCDKEYDDRAAYAQQWNLPLSTVARLLLLQPLCPDDDLQSALDRLEGDPASVRPEARGA